MAKLKHISENMVRQLYKVVDFYYWKGIPVARSWPRPPRVPPSPAMLKSRQAFKASRIYLKMIPPYVRAAWAAQAHGQRQAWLDCYTSAFMVYYKFYKRYPPVVTEFEIYKSETGV